MKSYTRNFDNFMLACSGFCNHRVFNHGAETSYYYNMSAASPGYCKAGGSNDYGQNGTYYGVLTAWEDGNINLKTTDGTVGPVLTGKTSSSNSSYNTAGPANAAPLTDLSICLGDGNTTPTYNDYQLSGNIIDNTKLEPIKQEYSYDSTTHHFKKILTCIYNNVTGDSDVTIKEWGIYLSTQNLNLAWSTLSVVGCVSNTPLQSTPTCSTAANSTLFANDARHVLMYREVLETPITIAAGTCGTITFEAEYPMLMHP